MKLHIYSDLHLEMPRCDFELPPDLDGDVLILAGDIGYFHNYRQILDFVEPWGDWPIIFVPGNHEHYTNGKEVRQGERCFGRHLPPNMHLLANTETIISGFRFVGGTMWTDLNRADDVAVMCYSSELNDARYITDQHYGKFIKLHAEFKEWFSTLKWKLPTVVVTHHQPTVNPNSLRPIDTIRHCFVATDMDELIKDSSPLLWVHGHTHENTPFEFNGIPFVSNQRGYGRGDVLGRPFDPRGLEIIL